MSIRERSAKLSTGRRTTKAVFTDTASLLSTRGAPMSLIESFVKAVGGGGGKSKGGGVGQQLFSAALPVAVDFAKAKLTQQFHPDQLPGVDPFGLMPGGRPPGLPALPGIGGGGASGITGMPKTFAGAAPAGFVDPKTGKVSGYHFKKDGSGVLVRNRRMNVCNMRAARRAVRRLKGAMRELRKIERLMPKRPAPRRRASGTRHITGPQHT